MSEQGIPPARDEQPLSGRVAAGAMWIVAARFFSRAIGLLSTLILARLLVPADFGVVAIGFTIMQLIQNLSDFGLSQTVIKFRNASDDDLDTLFSLSVLRGIMTSLLMLAISPFAGQFFGDPRLSAVFCGIALVPLLTGLINPKFYEFERDLNFSKEFQATILNKLVGVIIAVSIAILFRTYWAIIIGQIAGAAVQLVVSYAMRPYRPSISFKSANKVFGFTGWLTIVSAMAALNNKLDTLILGRLLGSQATGVYYIGEQVAELPTAELATPIARAIYPGMSELQDAPAKMRAVFLRGVEALGAIAMPASFGVAFLAEDLVALILGAKWHEASLVLQILTPALGIQALFVAIQAYVMASGKLRLIFIREVIYFLYRTPIFIWASLQYGLVGAITATAICGLGHAVINMFIYANVSAGKIWEPVWAARRSLLSVAMMSSFFIFLRDANISMMPDFIQSQLISRLVFDASIGAIIYSMTHLALWKVEGKPYGIESMVLEIFRKQLGRISN